MGETANTEGANGTDESNAGQAAAVPAPEEKIERVDLSKPRMPAGNPGPAPVVAPRKPMQDVDKGVGDDIAKILNEVKLPERPGTAPAPAEGRSYDTALGVDPEKAAAEIAEKQARVREAARAVTDSLPASSLKTTDDVRSLHTLKDDLQDVVRNKKISLVRAAALEEEKRHRPRISPEEETAAARPARRTSFSLVLTLALFLIGAGALGGTYFVLSQRATSLQAPVTSRVLFSEETVPFPIAGLAPADIRREIANARNAGTLTLGAILEIVPVQTAGTESEAPIPISFGAFMQAIGAEPPQELVRALGNEFFFGIHTVDENAPVFVIPIASYERAFAGMLAWEKTMNNDLAPIFAPVPMQTIGPDGILVERTFDDLVIRNYDVRALKDESGTIQLYYSFPTRNILIIAESQYSFAELLARLRADRRL